MSTTAGCPEISPFAERLTALRKQQGLSLCQLATRSGISKSSLSRWEAGLVRPRVPELLTILSTLGVAEAERRTVLMLLSAPRGSDALATLAQTSPAEPILVPRTGDLLRALRQRAGLTQKEVANWLGVQQASVARWEASTDWPSLQRLEALRPLLITSEEEFDALTHGPILEAGSATAPDQDLVVEYLDFMRNNAVWGNWDRADLHFLGLEARLWVASGTSETYHRLLMAAYSAHARYLFVRRRYAEAERYLAYLLRSARTDDAKTHTPTQEAVMMRATLLMRSDARPMNGAEAALRLLLPNRNLFVDPEYRAWFYMKLALAFATIGNATAATEYTTKCLNVPSSDGTDRRDDPDTVNFRAAVAQRLGQWDAALADCDRLTQVALTPFQSIRRGLRSATLLLHIGEKNAAERELNATLPAITHQNMLWYLPEWEQIARQM